MIYFQKEEKKNSLNQAEDIYLGEEKWLTCSFYNEKHIPMAFRHFLSLRDRLKLHSFIMS